MDRIRRRIRNRSRGFTLIELLVVIAIIALLASILFPVFARARESARKATCQSNLKQVGLGLAQYINDFDGVYPLDYFNYATASVNVNLVLQPYIKSGTPTGTPPWAVKGGVFQCPSQADTNQGNSYLYNLGVFIPDWNDIDDPKSTWCNPTNCGHATTEAFIQNPSQKVDVYEAGMQCSNPGGACGNTDDMGSAWFVDDEWYWVNGTTGAPNYKPVGARTDLTNGDCDVPTNASQDGWNGCAHFPRYRHNSTSDFLFLDGHVKALAKGQLDWYNNINVGRDGWGQPISPY